MCPDTCFRVWHTERLEGGSQITRRKRKKAQVESSDSNGDDSEDYYERV